MLKKRKKLLISALSLAAAAFSAFSLWRLAPAELAPSPVLTEARVYFLDVGQADCELIMLPDGKNILIDAGLHNDAKALVKHLKKLGVKKIDLLIASHPHSDHIGGMDTIIESFEIGQAYMPKLPKELRPTTVPYECLLTSLIEKDLKLYPITAGMTLLEQDGIKLETLAPCGSDYNDLNQVSAAVKFTYGEKSFLFTGDIGTPSEREMLDSGQDLRADVLKVGHHGSSDASSKDFLKAVRPLNAVISCGADNEYGHPNSAALKRLAGVDATIWRTDTQGTILASCNGKKISFTTGLPSVAQ